jgi:hypothetical protein
MNLLFLFPPFFFFFLFLSPSFSCGSAVETPKKSQNVLIVDTTYLSGRMITYAWGRKPRIMRKNEAILLVWHQLEILGHRKKKLWHSLGIRTYGSGMAGRPFFPLYDLAMPEIHPFWSL